MVNAYVETNLSSPSQGGMVVAINASAAVKVGVDYSMPWSTHKQQRRFLLHPELSEIEALVVEI